MMLCFDDEATAEKYFREAKKVEKKTFSLAFHRQENQILLRQIRAGQINREPAGHHYLPNPSNSAIKASGPPPSNRPDGPSSLPAEFNSTKVGKPFTPKRFSNLLIGLFKRGVLLFVAGKIQRHQYELAIGVAGEFVGGQHVLVKFLAPATPIRAGKVEQHHPVFRPRLI